MMHDTVAGTGDGSRRRGDQALERYGRWIVNQRRWVILVVLMLTLMLGALAPRQQVIINQETVVPQSHPYVMATNLIERLFGSKNMIVIGVTPKQGDALQPAVIETVQRLTDKLHAAPSVVKSTLLSLTSHQAKSIRGTADGFDVRPLVRSVPATPDEWNVLRTAIAANPVYQESVLSKDGRTATILVEVKQTSMGARAKMADVYRILDEERRNDMSFSLSGNLPYLQTAEVLGERMLLLFPLAVLVIGLLHFEAFRTLQGLVLPLVTALMSVVWGEGVMGIMGMQLDIFNSATPILILALAAGHAVQLLKRYYEIYIDLVRNRQMPPAQANQEAAVLALAAVGPVLVIAGGVAAVGFFSLVVFDLQTVRAFGIFTGFGILSAVALEFTFTPAVRASLKPPTLAQIDTETRIRVWDRVCDAMLWLVLTPRRRACTMAAVLAAALALATAATLVKTENSNKLLFSKSLQLQRDDALLNQQTGGTNILYVMIDSGANDGIKNAQVMQALRALQQRAAMSPIVGKTLSIDDFLRRMHGAASSEQPGVESEQLSEELIAQYLFLYSLSGDPDDFSSFVDYDYRHAKLSIMLRANSIAQVAPLVADLRKFADASFPSSAKVWFGGEVMESMAITEVMVHSKILNIAQILSVIFLVSVVTFRSLFAGLLVLSPQLTVVALIFGAMGLFAVPLNVPNALISAMAVGIGADYAIYLIYRTREFSVQGLPIPEAVSSALRTAGKACLFVATAVAGGYSVLLLSMDYNVHIWLGSFIMLAMLGSVAASLTLIPGALLAFRPKFVLARRSGGLAATVVIFVAAAGFLTYAKVAKAAGPTAEELMERNAAITRFLSSQGVANMLLENQDGAKRERQGLMLSKLQENGRDTKRMVRFDSPADIKGTATLLVENSGRDDDLWIFLPATKKVRRLSASNKRDSFAGTDFSYGDMMGYKTSDWKHVLLGEKMRDGIPHLVIESVPVSDSVKNETGYSKRTSWLRKDTLVTTFVDALDVNGQPYKQFVFSDHQPMDSARKQWQPMKARATNLQSKHVTTITYSDFKVGMKVPDESLASTALAQP